jgi:hypothetical protein
MIPFLVEYQAAERTGSIFTAVELKVRGNQGGVEKITEVMACIFQAAMALDASGLPMGAVLWFVSD